jgi:cbb3-type cytochrome oxidase subunit 3
MIGLVRGLITLTLMLLFIAYTVWAWSRSRKDTFDSMARMPLDDLPLDQEPENQPGAAPRGERP